MKKFIVAVLLLTVAVFSVSVLPCEAKDIWVDRWQNSNADVYVMDETLVWEENLEGKLIRDSTKEGQKGRQKRIVK